jgi:hypothetical protein
MEQSPRRFSKTRNKKSSGRLICSYCGKNKSKDEIYQAWRTSHGRPLYAQASSGGGDPDTVHSNFAVCCHSCNQKKAAMKPERFYQQRIYKKETF